MAAQRAGRSGMSVVDRINGERLVVLGWPRAILMQIAHPLIAAGVADHSTFRENAVAPIRRLHGTVKAMLGLTFGTAEEQARVIAGIKEIHARVHGTLREDVGAYPAGTPYSAEDPGLVLWVHGTLIDTSVLLYEAVVGTLSTAERNEYCRRSAGIAVALGADAAAVPREWDELTAYVRRTISSPAIAVGSDAHELRRAILESPAARVGGPVSRAARRLTIGLLPQELREQYHLPFDARDRVRLDRLLRRLRRIRACSPEWAARWGPARR
jgi:uncharacterized protein (DUF2236 family)